MRGRPRKDPRLKASRIVSLRLTAAQYQKLARAAARAEQPLSTFIKDTILLPISK